MKKQLLFYFFLLFALHCFGQFYQEGDIQLGYKVTKQKRNILVGEYFIAEKASLYLQFDLMSKSASINELEKIKTNSTVKGWAVGGRRFSPGLFHDHLHLFGDFAYGQFDVVKNSFDMTNNTEIGTNSEKFRFTGLGGGFTIRPLRHISIDFNLFRIGVLEKTSIDTPPVGAQIKVIESKPLFRIPFLPNDLEGTNIRVNFIFLLKNIP